MHKIKMHIWKFKQKSKIRFFFHKLDWAKNYENQLYDEKTI